MIAGQKRRTIKSAPGERSRDGNPGEGYSSGEVPAARAHGSSSLNFDSDMIIDIAVRLTYLHRRRMDGRWSFSSFDNFASTVTKTRLVVYFTLFDVISEILYYFNFYLLKTIFFFIMMRLQLQQISMHLRQVDLHLHMLH